MSRGRLQPLGHSSCGSGVKFEVMSFRSPKKSIGDLGAEAAGQLLAAAADVALIVDESGVIRDLAIGSADLLGQGCDQWLGRPLAETVTAESRPKVEALLRDSRANVKPRWRHINHPSTSGADLPLSYAAIDLPAHYGTGKSGARSVIFGRDLRPSAALQQRLISAQQAMERDYWRLRHMETRYRSLFQVSGEAVLILDAVTTRLEEANPAATALLGADTTRLGSTPAASFVRATSTDDTVPMMLNRVAATGHDESLAVMLSDGRPCRVAAPIFRRRTDPDEAAAALGRRPRCGAGRRCRGCGRAGIG